MPLVIVLNDFPQRIFGTGGVGYVAGSGGGGG